jgi:hypothetical protein
MGKMRTITQEAIGFMGDIIMAGRLSGIRTQNGEPSNSIVPFYIIAALPDSGRNYRPKHVVVTEMNKRK